MTNADKISMLEEMLELEKGELNEGSVLTEMPQFNSMAKLSLIVMFDDEFGKKLTDENIRSFRTVKDVLDFME